MSSATGSRSFCLRMLLCVFLVLLLAGSAAAWEESFEGNTLDLSTSSLSFSGYSGYGISGVDHGYAFYTGYLRQYNGDTAKITIPFGMTNYIGYSVRTGDPNHLKIGAEFRDSNNQNLISISTYMCPTGKTANKWIRIEWKENAAGTGIELYFDGVYQASYTYLQNPKPSIDKAVLTFSTWSSDNSGYCDDITTSSSHSILAMDETAYITDTAQYFKLGVVPPSAGKSYIVKVLSPQSYSKVMEFNLTSTCLEEQTIPIANLSGIVGDYTLHVYRHDSPTSETFLCMKTFTLTDPSGTNEGSIELDKSEYEAGDTVGAWVHLNSYSSGYLIRCDFQADGANFKKEIPVTANPFYGSFTVPDISNVIGSHTVQLVNPSGNLVDSAEFTVYIPGLPDIALDKSLYERTDKAVIYYKNAKEDSSITVNLRYGGTTAQTLTYDVEGTGTLTVDLSVLPAADSMLVILKESDGWANDDDNAKIVVGNFIVKGRVYDGKTGAALSGASVTIQGSVTNTDSSGNYNLSALAGYANFSVVKTGYNSITGTVAVFNMDTLHNFYLTPVIENGGTGVHGTVVSSKTDLPLTGASVIVINKDNQKRYSTIVNSVGYYELNNVDLAGNLTVTASYSNYDTLVANTLVNSGSMNNLNFRLNAVSGYTEVDISQTDSGSDTSDGGKTAAEKEYEEKYGEMGRHPFDFNGDGTVENSEWKYAGERFVMLIGILAFMGFLILINRRR